MPPLLLTWHPTTRGRGGRERVLELRRTLREAESLIQREESRRRDCAMRSQAADGADGRRARDVVEVAGARVLPLRGEQLLSAPDATVEAAGADDEVHRLMISARRQPRNDERLRREELAEAT
jgi:hypothetical protein